MPKAPRKKVAPGGLFGGTNAANAPKIEGDYANEHDTFEKDVIGDDESDSEDVYDHEKEKEKARKRRGEEETEEPAYMFFDFRRGIEKWPTNVEYVDPNRAELLLEKATTDAAEV